MSIAADSTLSKYFLKVSSTISVYIRKKFLHSPDGFERLSQDSSSLQESVAVGFGDLILCYCQLRAYWGEKHESSKLGDGATEFEQQIYSRYRSNCGQSQGVRAFFCCGMTRQWRGKYVPRSRDM
jgi:hypothetical protein